MYSIVAMSTKFSSVRTVDRCDGVIGTTSLVVCMLGHHFKRVLHQHPTTKSHHVVRRRFLIRRDWRRRRRFVPLSHLWCVHMLLFNPDSPLLELQLSSPLTHIAIAILLRQEQQHQQQQQQQTTS
jgi:hypothetical protein